MRKMMFVFSILMILIINACGVSNKTQVAVSATPTVSPTDAYTSTRSITPSPTIPTFDISKIVTTTPSEKVQCPIPNEVLEIELPQLNDLSPESLKPWLVLDQKILHFLNQGGQVQNLALSYEQEGILNYYGGFLPMSLDLTGDLVDEIIVFNPVNIATKISPAIFVFGCKDGQYAILFTFQQSESSEKFQNLIIKDMNANNLPELVFQLGHTYPEISFKIWIYEYQNDTFKGLLSIPYDNVSNGLFYNTDLLDKENIIYKDYLLVFSEDNLVIHNEDKNPFEEIILERQINYSNAPSRFVKIIYAWNGLSFSFYDSSYIILE